MEEILSSPGGDLYNVIELAERVGKSQYVDDFTDTCDTGPRPPLRAADAATYRRKSIQPAGGR
jgi:hypothetical protein